jgi:hypothetical protein
MPCVPFRFWFYSLKAADLFMTVIIMLVFKGKRSDLSDDPFLWAIFLVTATAYCISIITLGKFSKSGKLRVRCPFCGAQGPFGFDFYQKMPTRQFMSCPTCGVVEGKGFICCKIVATAKGAFPVEPAKKADDDPIKNNE